MNLTSENMDQEILNEMTWGSPSKSTEVPDLVTTTVKKRGRKAGSTNKKVKKMSGVAEFEAMQSETLKNLQDQYEAVLKENQVLKERVKEPVKESVASVDGDVIKGYDTKDKRDYSYNVNDLVKYVKGVNEKFKTQFNINQEEGSITGYNSRNRRLECTTLFQPFFRITEWADQCRYTVYVPTPEALGEAHIAPMIGSFGEPDYSEIMRKAQGLYRPESHDVIHQGGIVIV